VLYQSKNSLQNVRLSSMEPKRSGNPERKQSPHVTALFTSLAIFASSAVVNVLSAE
jgi:hypothetical protein